MQRAAVEVLNATHEGDFLGFSDGFRPGRGAHDALDALCVGITSTEVGFILDADIRSFFDYHAVPTNSRGLAAFRSHVTDLWRRTLRRRSQKDVTTWMRIARIADDWLPRPRILHPWPNKRFVVKHPRWEP